MAEEAQNVAAGEIVLSDEELQPDINQTDMVAGEDDVHVKEMTKEEIMLVFAEMKALMVGMRPFEGRLRPYFSQIDMYGDPARQEAARMTVPVEELEKEALVSLTKEFPSEDEKQHAFLLQLLSWFKKSFSWVNEPPCDGCGGSTARQGTDRPHDLETQYAAARVELYGCNSCSTITRFPRYNDPGKLVETRKGSCGEWANCFALYCRAFGYETRLILDFTDHLWTECFSKSLGRWMHLDPCEGKYDEPLLYESEWGKKLNYVIAFAKDGVYDVTKRYTNNWDEVLSRRNITSEENVSAAVEKLTRERRQNLPAEELAALEERDRNEREALEG